MTRTRNEIEEIVINYGYTLIDEYMDKNWRKIIIHDDDGYKYDVQLGKIKHYVPRKFDISNPYTLSNISLWLQLNNKNFELSENNNYIGRRNKLEFYCLNCKNYFYDCWSNISKIGKCSICTSLSYKNKFLAKEWIKSKNHLTPLDVTEYSNERVYWKCSICNHEWWAVINDRSKGSGCPNCAQEQQESKIATECKQYFYDNYNAESEYKLLKNPKTNQWLKCDIYIPENIFIEIHGGQHYKKVGWDVSKAKRNNTDPEEEFKYRQHLDSIKKEYAEENGIYIEVDLRKIKTTEDAIVYIENIINNI